MLSRPLSPNYPSLGLLAVGFSLVVVFLSVIRVDAIGLRATEAFGPAFHADPGSWTGFSNPESELDGSTNLECPYPPCRQLRSDLLARQNHAVERLKLLTEDVRNGNAAKVKTETERDDSLKPSPLNKVEGGPDCLTCEEVLVGEGINPRNTDVINKKLEAYVHVVATKILSGNPNDLNLKKHIHNVRMCAEAFQTHACTVRGKIEVLKPVPS